MSDQHQDIDPNHREDEIDLSDLTVSSDHEEIAADIGGERVSSAPEEDVDSAQRAAGEGPDIPDLEPQSRASTEGPEAGGSKQAEQEQAPADTRSQSQKFRDFLRETLQRGQERGSELISGILDGIRGAYDRCTDFISDAYNYARSLLSRDETAKERRREERIEHQNTGPAVDPLLGLGEEQEHGPSEGEADGSEYLLKLTQGSTTASEQARRLHQILSEYGDALREEQKQKEQQREAEAVEDSRDSIIHQIHTEVALDPELSEIAEEVTHTLTNDPNFLNDLSEEEVRRWLEGRAQNALKLDTVTSSGKAAA